MLVVSDVQLLSHFLTHLGCSQETCTNDVYKTFLNVSIIFFVNSSIPMDRKLLQSLECVFVSVPTNYGFFYGYSKLTLAN